ncbi:hypothetical protein [Pseudomonas sp. NPDC079086]|uniref:hypothetical protein n=1 Tax=unclassified Pseudomonas TaxID=196821 RepID=UPI0037C797FA
MRRLIALKYALGCIATAGLPLSLLTMTPAIHLQMSLPALTVRWVAFSRIILAALILWVVCTAAVFVAQVLIRKGAVAGWQS